MKDVISVISGILFVCGLIPYIVAILQKKIKPVMASWLVWAIIDTLIMCAMCAKNSTNGQIIGAGIGMWVVVFFIFRHGTTGSWTRVDKFCFCLSILGIVLWQLYENPILGLFLSLCAAFISTIPTFVSVWKDPLREDKLTWLLLWLSCVFAVIAIPQWTFAAAAQPVEFFTIETIMVLLIFRRRKT